MMVKLSFIPFVSSLLLLFQVNLTSGQPNPMELCHSGKKLCLGLPADCTSSSTFTCKMLVTISPKPILEDGLDVDVYSKDDSPGTYYAVGFVPTKGMSGAIVVHCDHHADNYASVGEGYTSGYKFEPQYPPKVTQTTSAGIWNGQLHCHWTHKAKGSMGDISYNVETPYYVQLAYGPMNGESIRRHSSRSITESTVNLQSVGIINTSMTLPILIRLHGSFMMVSWLSLVTIAMMIARYHKNSWGDKTIGNVKVWFALHRGLMILALLLSISGMISIFLHVKGWRADSPHQYLGLIANIFMFLQPLGALLRPAPDHPKRIFFNIGHFVGGNIGFSFAIFALFFVLSLPTVTISKGYLWVLVVFLINFILTHLILQFHPRILSTLNVIEDIRMTDLKNETANQPTSPPVILAIEKSKKRVLIIFIGLVIVLNIILIIFINKGTPK